jgi:anti-sigma B factor antagonist
MAFQTEETEGAVRIRIEGSLSIYEAVDIRNEFLACLEKDLNIECDLNGVADCDTVGLQLLFAAHRTANQKKKALYFKEIPQAVRQTLLDLGLGADDLLDNAVDQEGRGQFQQSMMPERDFRSGAA